MRESKTAAVNVTKERVVILVKLRIALCCHAGMAHNGIHALRNMNHHLPSGNRTFVDTQAVVEVIGDAGCIRAAHLTLSGEGIQNFVLCVSAQALRKVD